MDIGGMNLDPILAAAAPIASLIGLAVAVLGILGIAAFIIMNMRKNNTLIFPWEYKWNVLVWRPTGNTSFPFVDKGATIFEGRTMKLRLQRLGFHIAMPAREFIHPGNWIEGFSNGFRHFVIIKRTFTGYHKTPDIGLFKQLSEVQVEIEKQAALFQIETMDKKTKEEAEEKMAALERIRQDIEGKMQEDAGLDNAYEPELDANATNVQIHENEKIALNFPNLEGISKEMILLGLMIMIFFLSALFYLQAEGSRSAAAAETNKAIIGMATVQSEQNILMNKTLDILNYTLMRSNYPTPVK